MKYFTQLLLIFTLTSSMMIAKEEVNIIHRPNNIEYGEGKIPLKRNIDIIALDDVKKEAEFLSELLEKGFGSKANWTCNKKKRISGVLVKNQSPSPKLTAEPLPDPALP